MTKTIEYFTIIMHWMLKFLLLINIIAVIILTCISSIYGLNSSALILTIITISATFGGYKIINMNMSSKYKLILILIISFFLRVLWLLNINSIPTSDFKTIYDSAGSFIDGNNKVFYGVSYLGRFPHLTIITLYMALIKYLFPLNNLLVMKIINLILSILVLILIYLIIKTLYRNKTYGLVALLIGSIFPPFISYTGVYCSENLAIPFYLLSIYLFLVSVKNENKALAFIGCGITLAIGNLLRMVAIVVIIAYSLYIVIYFKDTIVEKFLNIALIIVPYVLIICLVSFSLQELKITDHPLWKGSEPNLTNVLKGTNYNSFGAWNSEDAKLIDDNISNYDKLESLCKDIILDRLTTTPISKIALLYLGKFASVWSLGDSAGVFWSEKNVNENTIKFPIKEISILSIPISSAFQLVYLLILMLALAGLFNKNKLNAPKEINLFYIILCGYGLIYLITEAQARYSYIVSWIFIILAISGLDCLKIFRNSFVFYNNSL